MRRTEHTKGTANNRRLVGGRLTEVHLGVNLPQPRFAREAADWIGKDGDEAKVMEAVALLADAEKGEQSLREFRQALTGRPWTNGPENLTSADEDAIVAKVVRERPAAVAEVVAKDPVATDKVISDVAARPRAPLPEAPFTTPPPVGDPATFEATAVVIEDQRATAALQSAVIRFTERATDAHGDPERTARLLTTGQHSFERLDAAMALLRGVDWDAEEIR